MAFTPELAKTIVEKISGAETVLSTRGNLKGDHVSKTYRFEFVHPVIRHIAIARETKNSVSVYVNRQSIHGVTFSNSIVKTVQVTKMYPKGHKGPTGDHGLSGSVARLSSLNPENNEVLLLSVSTTEDFQQLLSWYLDLNSPKPPVPNESQDQDSAHSFTDQTSTVIPESIIPKPEQDKLEADTQSLVTDEREAVVKVRYGQGSFRDALIGISGEKCWMTGLEGKQLLIASHIKPWSHCNSDTDSRGQPDNGLLLSALWDSAFDAGLITFDKYWNVVSSSELSESAKISLNIKQYSNLPEIFKNDCRGRYLDYHRAEVFEYWKKS